MLSHVLSQPPKINLKNTVNPIMLAVPLFWQIGQAFSAKIMGLKDKRV